MPGTESARRRSRVPARPGAVDALRFGLRYPVAGGWPPLVWVSALLVLSPLVLPVVVLLGYLHATGRAAAAGVSPPTPGAARESLRDGITVLSLFAVLGFLLLIGTALLYLLVFLPTWTTDHPALLAVDVLVALAGVYVGAGAVAVLAGTDDLGAAVGAPLLDLCLTTHHLRTVAVLVATVLLALELGLRLGGLPALGAVAPYLALAVWATLGRSYRHAETRDLVPLYRRR